MFVLIFYNTFQLISCTEPNFNYPGQLKCITNTDYMRQNGAAPK